MSSTNDLFRRTRLTGWACAVALGFGFFSMPVDAQLFHVTNWWTYIHCHGAGQDHSPGESINGQNEVFSDDDFNYDQCHGALGQEGTCTGSDAAGNNWRVSCVPNIGVCVALMNCAGGGAVSCTASAGSAFAGTQKDTLSNNTRAFVHCDGPGSQDESYNCT